MSQYDPGDLESPLSGTAFINTHFEPSLDAVHSTHSGGSQPSYVVAGMIWVDTTTDPWILNINDGGVDIPLGTINIANNKFIPSNQIKWGGTAAGTANALTITPSPAATALTAGLAYEFIVNAPNTAENPTIAISGQTAKVIKCSIGAGKVNLPVGALQSGMVARVVYDGTNFILINVRPHNIATAIATAATVNLNNANGDYVELTGTVTVGDIILAGGQEKTVKCTGIFTITDGSANSPQDIINPGAGNIITAAGDVFVIRGEANGATRIINYQRADGTALTGGGGGTTETAVTLTTQTVVNFTSMPAGTTRILIGVSALSENSTSDIIAQIGDIDGFETSGYKGNTSWDSGSGSNYSNGFNLANFVAAAKIYHGQFELNLIDPLTNTWSFGGGLGEEANINLTGYGSKALSGELTQIRITTDSGTAQFDAGLINITYS